MKRLLFLALLAIGTSAFAEDYKYLTMGYSNVEKSITLETIQKITFQNGNVVVTTSEGVETFPLAEMEKMYFSATATGIEEMEKVRDGENETVNGVVYDLGGRRVSVPSVLPKGVYIRNGKKFVVK
ncbi:MAG: hypothetical protein IJT19_05115 [Bacteroidaceae bacterium]|nr:hypothetical protein [Bacteroidaceae bacterium]